MGGYRLPKIVTLEELREGAVFETVDGVRAVKSEYRYGNYPNHGCKCILLESGEYAHFGKGAKGSAAEQSDAHNKTQVFELDVIDPSDIDPRE